MLTRHSHFERGRMPNSGKKTTPQGYVVCPRRAMETAVFRPAQLPDFFAGPVVSCETMLIRNALRSEYENL